VLKLAPEQRVRAADADAIGIKSNGNPDGRTLLLNRPAQ
jgi:hypothetical protein